MDPKEEVKQRLDIVDFIGLSVVLKPAGRNFRGLCPFHSEKSPSFMVSSERQTFKCFGCNEGGDIFSFYMKQEGLTFPEALKDLAKQAGVELTSYQAPAEFDYKQRLLEAHHVASQYYHFLLTKHEVGKKAWAYLRDRGVLSAQISDLQIGYAPEAWQGLTDYLIRKKSFKAEELEQAGLSLPGKRGYYDRFRGRVMFPLADIRGNIVGFSGRVLPWTEDDHSGKYINSPETMLYHKSQLLFPLHLTKEAIRKADHVVVVEGELDVLASLRAGVKAVVAVKGSALTAEQVRLLKRFCQTIIIALDADSAGVTAAKRAVSIAQLAEMNVRVVELPTGKDPDELVKTNPKQWREAVKAAVGAYDFFIDIALQSFNPETVEGKQAITAELIPLLNEIQNTVVADHYLKKTAQVLGVEPTVIQREMQRQLQKKTLNRSNVTDSATKQVETASKADRLAEEILTLVLHHYQAVDWSIIPLTDFPVSAAIKILRLIAAKKPKNIISFAKSLPLELQPIFDQSFLQEAAPIESENLSKNLQVLGLELAKHTLRDRLSQLRSQISTVPETDQEALRQEINEVLLRLKGYNR